MRISRGRSLAWSCDVMILYTLFRVSHLASFAIAACTSLTPYFRQAQDWTYKIWRSVFCVSKADTVYIPPWWDAWSDFEEVRPVRMIKSYIYNIMHDFIKAPIAISRRNPINWIHLNTASQWYLTRIILNRSDTFPPPLPSRAPPHSNVSLWEDEQKKILSASTHRMTVVERTFSPSYRSISSREFQPPKKDKTPTPCHFSVTHTIPSSFPDKRNKFPHLAEYGALLCHHGFILFPPVPATLSG